MRADEIPLNFFPPPPKKRGPKTLIKSNSQGLPTSGKDSEFFKMKNFKEVHYPPQETKDVRKRRAPFVSTITKVVCGGREN